MMTLDQTAALYATVLRQLLPVGGYDTAPSTHLAVDVYAHARLLAKADLDAQRLYAVMNSIPAELLNEYEAEYGLPMQCTVNATKTIEERLSILRWIRSLQNVYNTVYLTQLLAIFGVTLIEAVKFKPIQSTAPCNAPVNTEQLRYKVLLKLRHSYTVDMACVIKNYLPAYLRVDFIEVPL